jgi:hypothetical protein
MRTNIGTEQQWQPIFEKYPGLMEGLNGLIEISDKYREPVHLPTLAHKIVFALANVCLEECWEILLLVSNDYLNGATKMLRGLYERALTLTYISQNPDKAQRFLDYGSIQEHRIIAPALKLTTEAGLDERINPSSVAAIRENFREHKPKFLVTDCRKCKTTKIAHSWDLDVSSMAEEVGNGFPQLLLIAYTVPTLQAHATIGSALSRMKSEGEHQIFDFAANRGHEAFAFVGIFGLMINVHRVSQNFLNRPIGEGLDRLEKQLTETFKAWAQRLDQ